MNGVKTSKRILPVSYTHLDVYKRQGQFTQYCTERRIFRIFLFQQFAQVPDSIRNTLDKMGLVFEVATKDVYKRQFTMCSAGYS